MNLFRSLANLLVEAHFHPSRLRRRAADPTSEKRITISAMALLFLIPAALYLFLWLLSRQTGVFFAPERARDWGRLGIAVGYLLVYVGAIAEGVAMGLMGGLAGVIVGGFFYTLPLETQFAPVFGLALGTAYNLKRGGQWRFAQGLQEAFLGGLVFLTGFTLLQTFPFLPELVSYRDIASILQTLRDIGLSTGVPAGLLFILTYLTGYLGLPLYPVELVGFTLRCWHARQQPEHAVCYLRRSPLTHECRRIPLPLSLCRWGSVHRDRSIR